MTKDQAIQLLGGSPSKAASAIGVSAAAVSKWPDQLTDRIAHRVIGFLVTRGTHIPAEILKQKQPEALDGQARGAITE